MPTFEISLDDGRKFHVDADSAEAAHAGIQQFLKSPKPASGGGVLDAARAGASNLLSGLGETGQRYFGAGQALKDAGASIAPQSTPETTLYDDQGLHAANAPNFAAAAAPGVAAAMAAARLTPGPIWAKLGAAGLVGLGSMAGNYAKEATAKRTGDANAPSSQEDLLEGVKRAGPEAALQSLPIGRFISGPTARLGLKGLVGSVARGATDAGAMGAGNAASDAYDQLYQGGNVDPNSVINAGLGGGLLGGTLGGARTLQDAKAAIKFRGIAGEDPNHISEAANRIIQSNENLGGNLSNPKHGGNAVLAAQTDVNTQLKSAVDAIKGRGNPNAGPLSAPAQSALARAQAGLPISDADAAALTASSGNPGAVEDLQRLGGVSRVLDGVVNTGYRDAATGSLEGGLSAAMENHVRALMNPVGALAGAGLAGLGGAHLGDMFAHSPEALAAIGGAYGLARFNDMVSGSRSPANVFAKRFTDPNVGIPGGAGLAALDAQAGAQQTPPPGANVGPTGPRVPLQAAGPWTPINQPQPAAPFNAAALKPDVQAVLKARMNALAMQNASQQASPVAAQVPAVEPPVNLSAFKGPLQAAIKARMNALAMQNAVQQAPAAPAAPPLDAVPDLSGMRGPVQAAIKARMNALAMQNAASQPAPAPQVAPQVAEPPVDLSGLRGPAQAAIGARMKTLAMQNSQQAKDVSDVLPSFLPKRGEVGPTAPEAAPELRDLIPIVSRLTKSNGEVKQKVEQKPAEAQQAAPPAPPQAQAPQAVPLPNPPPSTASTDDLLTIPDFLRRTAPTPAAPPEPPVQVAKQALAKLNGSKAKPAEKASTDEELAMSPRDYAEHAAKSMFVREGSEQQVRDAIEQREQWKRETAKKLSTITGQKEAALFKKLRESQYRQPIQEMRDFLVSKHPDDAEAITRLLSDEELKKVWKYGAPKK